MELVIAWSDRRTWIVQPLSFYNARLELANACSGVRTNKNHCNKREPIAIKENPLQ